MLTKTITNLFKVVKKNIANSLLLKADIESPTLTGVPKAPTASKNTNTTQIATTSFVVSEIADKLEKAINVLLMVKLL